MRPHHLSVSWKFGELHCTVLLACLPARWVAGCLTAVRTQVFGGDMPEVCNMEREFMVDELFSTYPGDRHFSQEDKEVAHSLGCGLHVQVRFQCKT